jgi:hypothetical protein
LRPSICQTTFAINTSPPQNDQNPLLKGTLSNRFERDPGVKRSLFNGSLDIVSAMETHAQEDTLPSPLRSDTDGAVTWESEMPSPISHSGNVAISPF